MSSFLEIFNWKKGECASAEYLWRTTVHGTIREATYIELLIERLLSKDVFVVQDSLPGS